MPIEQNSYGDFTETMPNPSLLFDWLPLQDSGTRIHCDVSTGKPSSFVPQAYHGRFSIISMKFRVHAVVPLPSRLSTFSYGKHPTRLPSVVQELPHLSSQQGPQTPLKSTLLILLSRGPFRHIHIDIVNSLPPSNSFTHIVTYIDRFAHWPIAVLTGKHLIYIIQPTTAQPPITSGLVERFQRQLKPTIISTSSVPYWAEHLPNILLSFRNTIKGDLGYCSAELVLGTTLRLPGEMIFDSQDQISVDPSPYKVLKRKPKCFILDRNDTEESVSIDKLKMVYLDPLATSAPLLERTCLTSSLFIKRHCIPSHTAFSSANISNPIVPTPVPSRT
nr:gag pol polyprotein [Hymenolepis microstoma]